MRILLAALACLIACRATPPTPVGRGVIAVGSDSVAFQLVGRGRDTVVFLAGGPMLGSRYLRDATKDVGPEHALLFVDLRGRGAAPAVRQVERLSLDTDVTDLEAVRRHFGFDSLRVVAHHWGSAVLLKYGLRYPGRIARAAIVSPFYFKGNFAFELSRVPHDTGFIAGHMVARDQGMDSIDPLAYCRKFWGMSFSPIEVTSPRVLEALAPAICDAGVDRLRAREAQQRQMYLSFGTWDWSDSIPHLDMPVLVIQGAGSMHQRVGAEQWAERLSQGRLLVAGETPLFPWLEAPAQFTRSLTIFFDGAWPEGATPMHHHLVTTP